MADVDPEKILAELEAKRLLLRRNGGKSAWEGKAETRNKALLIGMLVIIGLAGLALWGLSIVMEQIPRPAHPSAPSAPAASETR